MTKKTLYRLSSLVALTAGLIALPAEARAAIVENASLAADYWQEITIGIVVIGGAILIDMSSWSIMTDKR